MNDFQYNIVDACLVASWQIGPKPGMNYLLHYTLASETNPNGVELCRCVSDTPTQIDRSLANNLLDVIVDYIARNKVYTNLDGMIREPNLLIVGNGAESIADEYDCIEQIKTIAPSMNGKALLVVSPRDKTTTISRGIAFDVHGDQLYIAKGAVSHMYYALIEVK